MKIELRNIKFAAFASQETNCFAADVYLDGVKSIHVSNEGTGGPDLQRDYVPGASKRLAEHCKTLPEIEFHGMKLDQSPDIVIGDLLAAWQMERDVKRKLGRGICVTFKTKPGVFAFKQKYDKVTAAALRVRRPDVDKILNELSIEEAVKLFLDTPKIEKQRG